MAERGRLGGQHSRRNLPPKVRTRLAQRAAFARWAGVPAQVRAEAARKAVQVRWARYRARVQWARRSGTPRTAYLVK
jgi:hypothetical protein